MAVGEQGKVVPSGACHDCGGRCPYILHVKPGAVPRMEPRDDLRPCLRAYAYARKLHAPDRLKYPQRRVGKRGEGKFERISWDEALGTVAAELTRIRDTYGAEAILFDRGSGDGGSYLHSAHTILRVLNKFGGCTTMWGGASAEASTYASRVVYGTLNAQHTRNDLVNARLIILWGWNPAATVQGTGTAYWLVRAREAGARVVAVDPHLSASAGTWADAWLPVRAGTDTAVALAIAHTMIVENLQNQAFLDRYTVGFEQFRDYVLGNEDGMPKTAHWASSISGAPAEGIVQLARDYATTRPAALMAGFAPGRTRHGAEFHRAASTLAAMTGNIGINGGSPAAFDRPLVVQHLGAIISPGKNPTEAGHPSVGGTVIDAKRSATRVHSSKVWDAIMRGKEGGYRVDFKAFYIVGANRLNQFANIPRGVHALQRPELVVLHDIFMTPTAKFADILLPTTTHWERNDIWRPWVQGGYYLFTNQAVDPMYDCRSDFEIAKALGAHLGVDAFGDLSEDQWLRSLVANDAQDAKYVTDYDALQRDGLLRVVFDQPLVPFREQIEDPEHHPFPTPSGKIEIYSATLAALNDPNYPPIAKFFPEDAESARREQYPLLMTSSHSLVRAHSNFHNLSWLRDLQPQAVLMNAGDAAERGIRDGDQVLIFNAVGKIRLPAKVTETMMPGVVDIPEGAWYDPDEDGVDRGGSPNTLTPDEHAPGGGHVYNAIRVQVASA